ncbi:MAU2 chromatid cohesion factor homolog isoform X1 [Bicyclus anynana]|uniref:MAU2 chromatid cohesion factor homolog n=1 Tax=Bicyclus anynana TaxID=110368 RepID=A0ABM3LXS8_BICAN|nr:MAU2 chromatid cohesion factor homolog isoform X1 [Bicyclus anynana]
MASTQDAWYISLLGLAEHFRTSNPPDIKSCIQCLQAVFNFKPPQRVEARTHLQLGNILLTHTKNIDLARTHLEQSWCLSQTINGFDDVKFEAASVLAELFEQQGQPTHSKPILRKAIELSQHSVYWHCRLIFQLAQIHATEREYEVASSLLGVGVDYAQISNAAYTRVLFLLSRVMLLLIDKKIQEVLPLLNQAGHLVETWAGSPHQKEYLKVFYFVLQVCHYLMAGQVKSVKPCLKQLQQSIQTIMAPTWPDDDAVCGGAGGAGESFVWLSRQQLYVLVYLVTVMHSAQAGYMDKAHKYTEKALAQIDKLTSSEEVVESAGSSAGGSGARGGAALAWRLRMALLEHAALCRLVAGGKAHALHEIARAAHLLSSAPNGTRTHSRHMYTRSEGRAAAHGAAGARGAVPAGGGRQGARAARDRARRAPALLRAQRTHSGCAHAATALPAGAVRHVHELHGRRRGAVPHRHTYVARKGPMDVRETESSDCLLTGAERQRIGAANGAGEAGGAARVRARPKGCVLLRAGVASLLPSAVQ